MKKRVWKYRIIGALVTILGADCTMTVAMGSGDAQAVDLADKLVMALNVFDELKDHYNTYH